jgi:hypothetical protein
MMITPPQSQRCLAEVDMKQSFCRARKVHPTIGEYFRWCQSGFHHNDM